MRESFSSLKVDDPYEAEVDDRVFVFNRRASAALQMRLAMMRDQKLGIEHLPLIKEMLSAMSDDPDVLEILDLVGLEDAAYLMNTASKHLAKKDTPTTGQSDSSTGLPATTSATGSPAADSTMQPSPV